MANTSSRDCTFDAIVIGSGIGGLCTAALLARLRKKRVLVLERHYEVGGMTHTFARGRFKFEVGLHYVGRMRPGTLQRSVFDYVTGNALEWIKIPSPCERFIYPGIDFGVPDGVDAYRNALIHRFPDSTDAIRQYFRDVQRAAAWITRDFLASFLPAPVAWFLRLLNIPSSRLALQTVTEYMTTHFSDPRLVAVLTSQWGDFGATPDEAAFTIHATVCRHYFDGGWVPSGGSQKIANTIERIIEQHGGVILTNRTVTSIAVTRGRATGVIVADTRLGSPREERYSAPLVISNASAEVTYSTLLGGAEQRTATAMRSLKPCHSSVSLFIGLKESPARLGVNGENCWINTETSHNDITRQTSLLIAGTPVRCYLSFPSLRHRYTARHTAAIIALVDYSSFAPWRQQTPGDREPDYAALKLRIAKGLLDLADRHFPGLREMVETSELATPLTVEHYTARPLGTQYGFLPSPDRYRRRIIYPRTRIRGLYLTGTDVCTVGVVGGLMGGVATASAILGPAGLVIVVAAVRFAARFRRVPRPVTESGKPAIRHLTCSDKVNAELAEKTQLTDTVYEYSYHTSRPVQYVPGQYARIQYGNDAYGSYSIVSVRDNRITFIIDTKFGGPSAEYFVNTRPGDQNSIRLPLGSFTLRNNQRRKIFIATGTGVAPQLAMIEHLAENSQEEIDLYFGCRYAREAIIERYLPTFSDRLSVRPVLCVSRERFAGAVYGRVTEPLSGLKGDMTLYDFYVSGSPSMVSDVKQLLAGKGAANVYTELF